MSEEEIIQNEDRERQPFIIEVYNKEERLRERESKPKLGIRRLAEDKKLVSIDIDIPLDENTILKDKFDWDLTKDKLSPTDFSRELVSTLNLPQDYADKLKQQILSQIMQHIKAHTKQKTPEQRDMLDDQLYGRGYPPIRFNNEYPEQQLQKQQNQKKKMSRMRRNQMKRTTMVNSVAPNRYFKEKKVCRNCKNQNITPVYECKNCKMPFQLMQLLNFDDKRVKLAVKYYEKIANKIPLLTYQAKKRHFQKQDFDSFYAIYNKIKLIFETCDELSKQNLNQVKYIMQKYHEYFLNGQLDFNDQEIIYQKDLKKDAKQQDTARPKRQRGRPRKIKIINDDLMPNSENNDDSSSSESDSDGEELSQYTS